MLICPFCQFENTDNPQVCHQCGASLSTWYALCLPHQTVQKPTAIGPFLDANQRYRLAKSTATLRPSRATVIRVIDSRPEESSPLRDLQAAWLDNPQLDPTGSPLAQAVPAPAFPYLALQADYFPAVPEVYDAFRHDNYTALLIEDRASWPNLTKRWAQPGPDGALQQIQWLFEIALLWEGLMPWRRETTLLQINRLVIDSNHLLCLTHIDPTPGGQPVPLTKLGESWQQLLQMTHSPPSGLTDLVAAVTENSLTSIHDLKEALANLAECWKSASLPSPMAMATDGTQSDCLPESASSPSTFPQAKTTTPDAVAALPLTTQATPTPQPSPAHRSEVVEGGTTPGSLASVPNSSDEKADPPDLPTMVLPMKLAHITEAGQSHVGMQRNHNEDYFFARTHSLRENTIHGATLQTRGLYIVCDGMGGHASGEVASKLAVTTLAEFFDCHWQDGLPDRGMITDAVLAANQAIYNVNQGNASSGLGRMGTTLVMLLVHNLSAAVVHVGDSRLYSYRKRHGLQQLTLDHEVGQREINRGVEPGLAYARPDAYQLTQALGPRHQDDIKPSISYHDVAEDTLFLLCSDGLSDNDLLEQYETSHIAPMLSSKSNLEASLANLIDLANEHNGHDNITAIVTRLKLKPDMKNLPR
jgi:protein phosphatase